MIEDKQLIEQINIELEEVLREYNIVLQQVDIEKPQLEDAEFLAKNKANPSYFNTFNSHDMYADRFTYSENESVVNNGLYKGSKLTSYSKPRIRTYKERNNKGQQILDDTKHGV